MTFDPVGCGTIISLLLFSLSVGTLAEEIVPRSHSPNGKFALAFEPAATDRSEDSPEIWFINLHSHKHISAQLVPDFAAIFTTKIENGAVKYVSETEAQHLASNRQMMYETLIDGVRAISEKRVSASNYDIQWKRSSHRVTVFAGAHKFYWSVSFAFINGEFRSIKENELYTFR